MCALVSADHKFYMHVHMYSANSIIRTPLSMGWLLPFSRFCTYSLAVEIEMSLCQYFKSAVFLSTPSCCQHKGWITLTSLIAAWSIVRIWSLQATPLAKVEGVACLLRNLQLLESQSGLLSTIRNHWTTHSKPNLWYSAFQRCMSESVDYIRPRHSHTCIRPQFFDY